MLVTHSPLNAAKTNDIKQLDYFVAKFPEQFSEARKQADKSVTLIFDNFVKANEIDDEDSTSSSISVFSQLGPWGSEC